MGAYWRKYGNRCGMNFTILLLFNACSLKAIAVFYPSHTDMIKKHKLESENRDRFVFTEDLLLANLQLALIAIPVSCRLSCDSNARKMEPLNWTLWIVACNHSTEFFLLANTKYIYLWALYNFWSLFTLCSLRKTFEKTSLLLMSRTAK